MAEKLRPNDPRPYMARLIENGKVRYRSNLIAPPAQSYAVAHDGINVLAGQWVEVKLRRKCGQ